MTTPLPLTSRPWRQAADVAAMTAILSEAWAGPRRPLVSSTPGDLEWWTASGGPDVDWASRIRIWELAGAVVGWGWINPPASLDWFVAHGLTDTLEEAVRVDILAWLADVARQDRPTPAAPAAPATQLTAWAADGWPEQGFLVARGWTVGDTLLTQYHQELDLELDPPRVPDGYVLRSLRGRDDIPARVEAHRAAFAPSKLTVEKYEILVAQPHYAYERDIVLEAGDGTIAAFAMCWADPVGSVGEFEPVGVHPDHQRRGLGRVIMRHGLRVMRAAGLRDAVVFSDRSNAASEALYRSAGFDELAIHRQYVTPTGG
ncbi:MAG TPA: GNAT family N-acetyltransferase [Candidatus Limnocylindrales bacterium]|nr:GNAT family N-acetyltransferase [Candidatus Limnocylindrales bacterium]